MILDTNALSAFVDGDASVGEMLRLQARAAIPVIVLGEFRYGIAESRHRRAYEAWLASELRHFEVLAVTDDTAVRYAALRVALRMTAFLCWAMRSRAMRKVWMLRVIQRATTMSGM